MNLDLSSQSKLENVASTQVAQLELRNFRCYSHLRIDLSPSINVFLGPNGSGKTSVLEALHMATTTTSFRSNNPRDVIRTGTDAAQISVEASYPPTSLEIAIPQQGRRTARLNGTNTSRVSDLIGIVPVICFSSQDLQLISGDPSTRRRFLDREISQLSAAYLDAYAKYKRVVTQRNALLKHIAVNELQSSELEPWDERLAELGEAIRERRTAFLRDLSPFACQEHLRLSNGQEQLQLIYRQRGDGNMREQLKRSRHIDIAVGSTTVGPHRDDFEILVNGASARTSASQGQQRTAVLAIQLGVLAHWRNKEKRTPILLLDDIMSDLDQSRRKQILSLTENYGQVLLTATDPDTMGAELSQASTVFRVEGGTVTRG